MPIRINLLAEERVAEEMRRKDPVKRAIFIGISLVAVALMIGAWRVTAALLVNEKMDTVQTQIDSKTNAFQKADVNLKKIASIRIKLTQLEKLQAARFLQGNLLNALQMATVDGVQLTHWRMQQSYALSQPETVPGKPAPPPTAVERKWLRLEARDFSSNPGDQVQKFKDAIGRQPYLQSLLSKTNAVQLAGPPSGILTDIGRPYVNFSLDCNFPDVSR